ncbi:hypothetical protein [Streptomyces albireticuli]|uniref:hypothetical protein n=1 Tax=Streptomyces albireticuli TaxID=1940 RepID=UPI001180F95A|nr:hypothetical protein [Streptomyces albireticuli]MCD9145448.1 hypothetical protein [Streptomyces albireticuli]MCD9164987.1 hypothetical protein [Streptomyces albireticuli]MCD9195422.1 hypothetical protein [Streptomyces albireticuli]
MRSGHLGDRWQTGNTISLGPCRAVRRADRDPVGLGEVFTGLSRTGSGALVLLLQQLERATEQRNVS